MLEGRAGHRRRAEPQTDSHQARRLSCRQRASARSQRRKGARGRGEPAAGGGLTVARKKAHPEHENHERWLVSYADFITLLFAFFVVMFASSQTDKAKAQAGLRFGQASAGKGRRSSRGARDSGRHRRRQRQGQRHDEGPGRLPSRRTKPDDASPVRPELLPSMQYLTESPGGGDQARQNRSSSGTARPGGEPAAGHVLSLRRRYHRSQDLPEHRQDCRHDSRTRRTRSGWKAIPIRSHPHRPLPQQLGALRGPQHRHAGVVRRSRFDIPRERWPSPAMPTPCPWTPTTPRKAAPITAGWISSILNQRVAHRSRRVSRTLRPPSRTGDKIIRRASRVTIWQSNCTA